MSVPEFFSATLGTRIEPEGPSLAWRVRPASRSPHGFSSEGRRPESSGGGASYLATDLKVMAVLGNAHGDLHLQNILVSLEPLRTEDFQLIDLSGFAAVRLNSPSSRSGPRYRIRLRGSTSRRDVAAIDWPH